MFIDRIEINKQAKILIFFEVFVRFIMVFFFGYIANVISFEGFGFYFFEQK